MIGVLDIFAGPGGLAEGFGGFTAPSGIHPFDIRLSIEKDARAHETLQLRSFVRQFRDRSLPPNYCKRLKEGAAGIEALYVENPSESKHAMKEAWLAELGAANDSEVDKRIRVAMPDSSEWVLIGGPPLSGILLGWSIADDRR